MIFIVQLLDIRNFGSTRTTPRCPEVYQNIFSFSYIIRKRNLAAVRLLDREIGKHSTFGRLFQYLLLLNHHFYKRIGLQSFAGEIEHGIELSRFQIPVGNSPCTYGIIFISIEILGHYSVKFGHNSIRLEVLPSLAKLFFGQSFLHNFLLFGDNRILQRIHIGHKQSETIVQRSTQTFIGLSHFNSDIAVFKNQLHTIRTWLYLANQCGIRFTGKRKLTIGNHRAIQYITGCHIGQINFISVQRCIGNRSVNRVRRRMRTTRHNRCRRNGQ